MYIAALLWINAKRFTSNISNASALTVVANWRCVRGDLVDAVAKWQLGVANWQWVVAKWWVAKWLSGEMTYNLSDDPRAFPKIADTEFVYVRERAERGPELSHVIPHVGRFWNCNKHKLKTATWRNFHFRFSKFGDPENESLFKSSWWIFMCQNVNIIVYIWSPNLAICAIAKIGGCTLLLQETYHWTGSKPMLRQSPKKGNTHVAENYWPVSLTYVCCKILEHVVLRHMREHFE